MELIVGTILEGRVSGITKYGAFVSFEGGGSGLVHISEIANCYVTDVHDFLSIGQTVKVKVVSITPEGKINLSVKQALPPEEKPRNASRPSYQRDDQSRRKEAAAPYTPASRGEVRGPSEDLGFEEKLKLFMKDSDSKMSGNKLYADRKGANRRRK